MWKSETLDGMEAVVVNIALLLLAIGLVTTSQCYIGFAAALKI